jgi:hypothetical protein
MREPGVVVGGRRAGSLGNKEIYTQGPRSSVTHNLAALRKEALDLRKSNTFNAAMLVT